MGYPSEARMYACWCLSVRAVMSWYVRLNFELRNSGNIGIEVRTYYQMWRILLLCPCGPGCHDTINISTGLYIWTSNRTSHSHTNLTPIAPISHSPLVQTGGRTTLPTCGTDTPHNSVQFDFSPSSPARARSMYDPLLVCLIPDARIAISGQVRKYNEEAEE